MIVESPAKAKTIDKFLGKGYIVRGLHGARARSAQSPCRWTSTMISRPSIGCATKRESSRRSRLKPPGETVYLATDPDREGRPSPGTWRSRQARADDEPGASPSTRSRVGHRRRPSRIRGEIDKDLVNAQQARRILDRLVGYKLSPALWQKVRRGLSAGRVQSVAVRLIVDREREILAFVPEEYWSIEAELKARAARPFGQARDRPGHVAGQDLPPQIGSAGRPLLDDLAQAPVYRPG